MIQCIVQAETLFRLKIYSDSSRLWRKSLFGIYIKLMAYPIMYITLFATVLPFS